MVNIGELEGRPGVARLFGNNANGNNWLIVRTEGTRSNRDGIGATISLSAAGSTQRRTVTAGSSQMSQNVMAAHFGLGPATHVDTLTVRWSSGRSSRPTNVAPNQVLVVTEPNGQRLAGRRSKKSGLVPANQYSLQAPHSACSYAPGNFR